MNTNNSKPRCDVIDCNRPAHCKWSDDVHHCESHMHDRDFMLDLADTHGTYSPDVTYNTPYVVGEYLSDGTLLEYGYGDALGEMEFDELKADYELQQALDETQTAPAVAVQEAAAARIEHNLLSQTNVRDYATREAEAAEHNALCAGDSESDASAAYYDAYESALDYAAQHPEQFEEAQDAINN